MESLTLDDIDIYTKVSRRLVTEDVFSIVDTYFMPYGVECDRYSILGEILSVHRIQNQETGEDLYVMKLDVNELSLTSACRQRMSSANRPRDAGLRRTCGSREGSFLEIDPEIENNC